MTKFMPEKNFFTFFQAFSTYFLEEIMHKKIYLIHQGTTDHYIPNLVEEFYNSFTIKDIGNHAYKFT